MNNGEIISGWKEGDGSVNQRQSATQAANGFTMEIKNTGWDAQWDASPVTINPWSIQAIMDDVDVIPGHIYSVSFKAKASKTKYAYVAFGCDVSGTTPDGGAGFSGNSSKNAIKLGVTEQTFTYEFTNWVSAKKLAVTLNLGAFDAQYDYAGNPMTDSISDFAIENGWNGTVIVSDFTIADEGIDPGFTEEPSVAIDESTQKPTETVKPTSNPQPTQKPATSKLAKVKKASIKAKNTKKGVVKLTWAKVTKAKTYQVKVDKKNFTTKKASITVKKLKKGKHTVKIRAKAAGYKSPAWTTKKIRVKK
jgi:hypothetical protein